MKYSVNGLIVGHNSKKRQLANVGNILDTRHLATVFIPKLYSLLVGIRVDKVDTNDLKGVHIHKHYRAPFALDIYITTIEDAVCLLQIDLIQIHNDVTLWISITSHWYP